MRLLNIDHAQFEATIPGSSKTAFIRLGTTDVDAFEHVFINEEYGFSLQCPPKIIVDVGANIGLSAIYFARRFPEATIIALEPDPANFKMLEKNAERYPKIIPIHAALWNSDGSIEVYDSGRGSWGMRVKEHAPGPDTVRVPSITLNTLLDKHGISTVDLLKVDIEGAECEVLQDAHAWIDRIGTMCIELHDRFREGCSEAFERATVKFPVKWRRGELTCVARQETN